MFSRDKDKDTDRDRNKSIMIMFDINVSTLRCVAQSECGQHSGNAMANAPKQFQVNEKQITGWHDCVTLYEVMVWPRNIIAMPANK